jgi:hypothetical protein
MIMAKWKYKIDVRREWSDYVADKGTIQGIAKAVLKKLNMIENLEATDAGYYSHDISSLIMDFESLSEDPSITEYDFDSVMHGLYDWADTEIEPYEWPTNRMCAVRTEI